MHGKSVNKVLWVTGQGGGGGQDINVEWGRNGGGAAAGAQCRDSLDYRYPCVTVDYA